MTTDDAKPTVITAAEFVAEGYAERIAAGECVVRDNTNCIVLRVDPEEDGCDDHVLISYTDGLMVYSWAYERDAKFTVQWLPVAASSTDADEVARLRAEVARLREALEEIREEAANQGIHAKTATTKNIAIGLGIAARIARAALDATGEAGE